MNEAPARGPRILILTEGQLGDLLLLTPAIRGIKTSHPDASLLLLVVERRGSGTDRSKILDRSLHNVLSSNPHISALYSLRRDLLRELTGIRRLLEEARIVRFLRAMKPDSVISAFPEDRFALWAFASGASVRIGEISNVLRWVYNRTPERKKGDGSILDYYCELAELTGSHISSFNTEYFPNAEAERWADGFLDATGFRTGKFVVVHPGATGDYKIWPAERYREMIARLTEGTGLSVLLCGGPGDREVVDEVAGEFRSPALRVHIEENIDHLASLLHRAALVISNDSGPRHLAVSVGTPSLAVFRHHHDREWGVYPASEKIRTAKALTACPVCPPGRCNDMIPEGSRYGSVCLRAVPVQEVVTLASQMLVSGS